MKGAEPQAFDRPADEVGHPAAHLPGRLVGEGDGQDLPGLGEPAIENVGQAGDQHPGFARTRAGQHQNRPLGGKHSLALGLVQGAEIGRFPRRRGARPCHGRGIEGDVFKVERV